MMPAFGTRICWGLTGERPRSLLCQAHDPEAGTLPGERASTRSMRRGVWHGLRPCSRARPLPQ
ncbi:hypothetical protein GEV41_06250 [Pseudomonas putida]|nr:hypothetical protein GEV41_06250 [Pseudomonas putida]